MTTKKIEYPHVVSRAAWLDAPKKLLANQKAVTQREARMGWNTPWYSSAGSELLDLTALGRQEKWDE